MTQQRVARYRDRQEPASASSGAGAGSAHRDPGTFDSEYQELAAHSVFDASKVRALVALDRARTAYYLSFNELGISHNAIQNLLSAHHSLSTEEAFRQSRARF